MKRRCGKTMRESVARAALGAGLALGLLRSVAAVAAAGNDWPCFHGPRHDGISTETGWSVKWPEAGPKKLWEAKVGVGFSSMAVVEGRVYTMGNWNKTTDAVFCFDAPTGKELWRRSYDCPLDAKYYEGGTHATPTVDGGMIYTVSKRGQVFCLEAASGRVVWRKNVVEEVGATKPTWGFACSALVAGDRLILNIGGGGTAVEKATGKVIWKSDAAEAGYSTPVPGEFDGEKAVVLFLKEAVAAVRIQDGKELWRHPWKTAYDVNAADPIIWNQEVFIASGYKKGCCLLNVAKGKPAVVWQSAIMRNHFNNCVRLGDYLYGMDGDADDKDARLRCVEWKTGVEKWSQPVAGTGSLMAADGKLMALSGTGELSVIAADPSGFKALAKARVLDGKCWTVPVLSDGRLYVRNAAGVLACFELSGGQ